jgi:hypothetical protein
MAKYGMYTKGTNESTHHVNVVDTNTKAEAEAYFAGMKRLSLVQFQNLFEVREVQSPNSKNLLLG